jgi:RNA polymerase sigma-70 factor, ECF subfamily
MNLRLVSSTPAPEEARGNPDSLDELYRQHAPDVKRWAFRLAGPGVDLDDLLHDVFVIALRRHFTFRGDASITTWLFRITSHVVRGRRRRNRIRDLLFRRHRDELVEAGSSPSTPQEEIERCERHRQLYAALDRLPDCYRTTLILYEIERLSGEDVAELTGVSIATVWVRLHRGRKKLLDYVNREERR